MDCECHGHIILDGKDYKKAVALHADGLKREVIDRRLEDCALRGIRFYRDGGDVAGATAYAARRASRFGIDYRTPVFAIYKKGHYGGMFGNGFDTLAEYEQLVRQVQEEGGHYIKLMISGINDFNVYGRLTGGTLEAGLIRDMVQAAHETGFAVMAHVNTAQQVTWALEAGVNSIEHGYYMDDGCLRLLQKTGAVWVPTFSPVEQAEQSGLFPSGVPAQMLELHRRNLKSAVDLGVLIACGSDAGSFLVPPSEGCGMEQRYLETAVGSDRLDRLQKLMEQGAAKIRETFRPVSG